MTPSDLGEASAAPSTKPNPYLVAQEQLDRAA